ncbi:hypothetical protein HDE_14107 [Halotydeus destructor]|nr:hypothetical protein HDE_14107 [Halotydeus destructor]
MLTSRSIVVSIFIFLTYFTSLVKGDKCTGQSIAGQSVFCEGPKEYCCGDFDATTCCYETSDTASIVGVAIGGLIVVAIIIAIIVYLLRRGSTDSEFMTVNVRRRVAPPVVMPYQTLVTPIPFAQGFPNSRNISGQLSPEYLSRTHQSHPYQAQQAPPPYTSSR